MKKTALSLTLAAATAAAIVTLPAPAQAAVAWRSTGLTAVSASGSYSRTGNTVHFYGRLYDTGRDNRWAGLIISFTGECCAHVIKNKNGFSSSIAIDMKSTRAPHIKVKEITGNATSSQEGDWVTIY